MNRLSVRYMGLAIGATGALLYVGCVFVMLTVPHDAVVAFFNSLLHGWDVEPIMRWNMPWWEAVVGALETFILGWLIGALIAAIYNIGARKES